MLRINHSTSASGATRYFDAALSIGDYYAKDQGVWGGLGAERLGLAGAVRRDKFVELANNRDGEEKLTVRDAENRRVGYDFTFSVPKSLSLAMMMGIPGIEQMVQDAFRGTMSDIEAAMETRVRIGAAHNTDENRSTGNILWAAFTHDTTRPIDGIPDPHYHIHCYVFNATYDPVEERWKAGQFGGIKRDAPRYEAEFHARIANKLLEAGFGIRRTDRDFELASVSQELVDKFSKRTKQIEKTAREHLVVLDARARELVRKTGMAFEDAWAQIKSELGAETREKKTEAVLSGQELRQHWIEQMMPAERAMLTTEAAKAMASQHLIGFDQARELALSQLFERVSIARESMAAAMLLRRGIGRVSIDQAREFAAHDPVFQHQGAFVTTREVENEETEMLAIARAGTGQYQALGNGHDWTVVDEKLNTEQRDAVRHVLESRDLVMQVKGWAGTGKTSLTVEAVRAIESLSARHVITLAPSSSAVRELKRCGFRAYTVAKFFHSEELQDAARGQVLWVDEGSFVSMRQMLDVLRFCERHANRLILSGDPRQHHGVERGDALRLLEDEGVVRPAELKQILRQRLKAIREAVIEIASGRPQTGFDKLDAYGCIHEHENAQDRHAALAATYLELRKANKRALVVSPTHADGRAVADACRDAMRKEGIIGAAHKFTRLQNTGWTATEKRDAMNYRIGPIIEFGRHAKGGFRGRQQWEVAEVDQTSVRVRRNGITKLLFIAPVKTFSVYNRESFTVSVGERVRITKNFEGAARAWVNNDLHAVTKIEGDKIWLGEHKIDASRPLHIDQGIVVTSHAAQGKTVGNVIVSCPVSAFSQTNEAQFYVSASRTRGGVYIFTDSKVALREAIARPSRRIAARELLNTSNNEQRKQSKQNARASVPGRHPVHDIGAHAQTHENPPGTELRERD